MKAQPAPIVSGSHFLPAAPLLWTKLRPACRVMSLKVTCALDRPTSAAHTMTSENDFRMTFMARLFASSIRSLLRCDTRYGFRRRKRHGNMLVNQLAFVVVLLMQASVRPGDRLCRLVCLEAQIKLLVLGSLGGVTHP